MGNAGTLKVTLSADQAEFIEGMNKSADAVGKFAESSNKHVSSLQKSMEHLAAGKHFSKLVGEIGGALGGNAQLITSAIRNFQHFGPAVGLAATAIHGIVEGFKHHQEWTAKTNEVMMEYGRVLQDVGRYEGDLFSSGKFEKKYEAFAAQINKTTQAMRGQIDTAVTWNGVLADIALGEKGRSEDDQKRAIVSHNMMMNKEMELLRKGRADRVSLDNPLQEFAEKMFEQDKRGKGKDRSETRNIMAEKYELEIELVDKLTEKMETLKGKGEEYEDIWKEIKTHTLAAVNLKDEYKASMKKGIGQAEHLSSATSFNAAVISQLQHSGGGGVQQQHLAVAKKQLEALVEIKKMSGKQVAVAGA